jgi:hypothetical protein
MVETVEHTLGFDIKGRKETFQYVPLPSLLQFLSSHSDFSDTIAKQAEKDALGNGGMLSSYSKLQLQSYIGVLCI